MRYFKARLCVFSWWTLAGALSVIVTLMAGVFVVTAGASGPTSFYIPSGSMSPTFSAGSHVWASPVSASARIKRGEIVILKASSNAQRLCGVRGDLISRVIGLPGERLTSKGNTVFVNGKVLRQSWTHREPLGTALGNVTVSTGHYFVMGDNQSVACDSRTWGTVERSNIIDQVLGVVASSPSTTTTYSATLACQADGMTVSTAIAAFEAQNPGVSPTEASLLRGGAGNGGHPYISRWPNGAPRFAFSIDAKGALMVAIPATAKPTAFKGPASCDSLG